MSKLSTLMPGRYAKSEISSGFLGSIDVYAYRMPVVPEVLPGGEEMPDRAAVPSPSAQVTQTAGSR